MEYEKIILNLLERVALLEEKIEELEKDNDSPIKKEKPERGTYTERVISYINEQINEAKENGLKSITLISGNVQKSVGLKNRLPLICNAMRKCMDENAIIIHETPSGQSSTFAIKWNFQN